MSYSLGQIVDITPETGCEGAFLLIPASSGERYCTPECPSWYDTPMTPEGVRLCIEPVPSDTPSNGGAPAMPGPLPIPGLHTGASEPPGPTWVYLALAAGLVGGAWWWSQKG